MPELSFDRLRRWPDVEAGNLHAVDATDRLILDHAATAVRDHPADVVVIGDRYGALTLGAIAVHGATGVRVHQDVLTAELALEANAEAVGLASRYQSHPLDADLVRGAKVVLLQLPKSLLALREITEVVAAHAAPDVKVVAGGRVKHMTPAMNDALAIGFGDVRATLARQKSRLLIAGDRRSGVETTFPRCEWHDDLALRVFAHGAAFGGTKVDLGTRMLLDLVDRMSPGATSAVDLGCGTGVLAALLARRRPGLRVIATDASAAAVKSATETVRANGLAGDVSVFRDDAMSAMPSASVDLVVCNPPFHLGTTVHAAAATRLFAAAGRVLRPGGELWTVYNSHLGHEASLERLVGPTKIVGRDRRFTVTVSLTADRLP